MVMDLVLRLERKIAGVNDENKGIVKEIIVFNDPSNKTTALP